MPKPTDPMTAGQINSLKGKLIAKGLQQDRVDRVTSVGPGEQLSHGEMTWRLIEVCKGLPKAK